MRGASVGMAPDRDPRPPARRAASPGAAETKNGCAKLVRYEKQSGSPA